MVSAVFILCSGLRGDVVAHSTPTVEDIVVLALLWTWNGRADVTYLRIGFGLPASLMLCCVVGSSESDGAWHIYLCSGCFLVGRWWLNLQLSKKFL